MPGGTLKSAAGTPARWLLMTHGIYGAGSNWRSIARKLHERRPDWGVVLFDLRGHGKSDGGEPPHTVAACAQDVLALIDELGGVDAISGHSFGGKVVMATRAAAPARPIWVLDASPSAAPAIAAAPPPTVVGLLDFMARAPRWPDREAFVQAVVGAGHVRVNVVAQFSAATSEETEETWDPNSVIRSQQKSSDTTASASSSSRTGRTGGVAGARSNAPPDASTANGQTVQVAGAEGTAGRLSETTNYEIGKKTRHTVEPGGQVARLSVAVIVDDERTPAAEGKPAANAPRDPAVMERIKGLVATSVGLNTERGDQLTVENIAFEETVTPEEPASPWWKEVPTQMKTTIGVSISDLMRWALVAFLALVALFAVIRPMMRSALGPALPAVLPPVPGEATVPALAGATAGAAGKTVAELEQELHAAAEKRDIGRTPSLTRSIAAKVDSEPEHVAHVVRALIAQEEK